MYFVVCHMAADTNTLDINEANAMPFTKISLSVV